MRVHILRECLSGERRVAATPETVRKLAGLGAQVSVEREAGLGSYLDDSAYADAGATIVPRGEALAMADVVLCVRAPEPAALAGAKAGAWLVGILEPFADRARLAGYASLGIEALSMDLMPRITRAQSMDVLSSQSNLAGYRAVIDAANEFGRAFPMMMTAAGTVSAARVFVMGVGVAGLQAIATARRLGAQVSATDVRAATREQILSLGAKPVFVDDVAGIAGEGSGGYAAEMSEEYRKAQAELVSSHIARQDIVITTALIPGRAAPRLVSDAQLATMRPGSVIVDLAVEQGGNVEGAVAGQIVERHGVRIVGHGNVASRLPADASSLYARNLFNFLSAFWSKEAGRPILPDADEIAGAIRLTQGGKLVYPPLLAAD